MNSKIIATATTLLATFAFVASASATTLRGTVVHSDRHAHSFVVAARNGTLNEVHAHSLPALGRRVSVNARRLHNLTYAARSVHNTGFSRRFRIHGVVTFVNQRTGDFVVSARGVSMLVHAANTRRAHDGGATNSSTPSDGTIVTVDATLDNQDQIDAQSVDDQGEDQNYTDLHGQVLAIDTTNNTLTISSDDEDSSGGTITVDVPSTIAISSFQLGQTLDIVATPNTDGTFTLVSSSQDDSTSSADDQGSDDQGGDQGSDDQGDNSQ